MFKKGIYHATIVMALIVSFTSCKKNDTEGVVEYHHDYFPTDSGHYVIYDVDSIRFNNTRDTVHYQLMEVVGDTFYDNENELCRKLTLYRRADSNAVWTFDRLWHLKATAANLQKTEDDIRFVKLAFPPKANLSWNGNIYVPYNDVYSAYRDWDYHYDEVHHAYSINGFNFDSTATVSEVYDTTNVIERKQRVAVYAKHVGLVYQEWILLRRDGNILGSWDATVNSGFKIRMRIADHN